MKRFASFVGVVAVLALTAGCGGGSLSNVPAAGSAVTKSPATTVKGITGVYIGKRPLPPAGPPPPARPHPRRPMIDDATYLDSAPDWGISAINVPNPSSQSDYQTAVDFLVHHTLSSMINDNVVYPYIITDATSQWIYSNASMGLTVFNFLVQTANPPTQIGLEAGMINNVDDPQYTVSSQDWYGTSIPGCMNFTASWNIGTGDDLGASQYYLGFYRQDTAGNVYLLDSASLNNPGDFAPYQGTAVGVWNHQYWADDSSEYFYNLYDWTGSNWNLLVSTQPLVVEPGYAGQC